MTDMKDIKDFKQFCGNINECKYLVFGDAESELGYIERGEDGDYTLYDKDGNAIETEMVSLTAALDHAKAEWGDSISYHEVNNG
jgi:hypothetical protein